MWEVVQDVAGASLAIATAVAVFLGIWLAARNLHLLDRYSHRLEAWYLPPRDLVGFEAMPHFMVEYANTGNVPVTFSDFELLLPRLKDVIVPETGEFVLHTGAELFIDKRPTSRIGQQQMYSKIDYRTNKVRLEPGDLHTDFFDLGAFLPNFDPNNVLVGNIPDDFAPILAFRDSHGNHFHCDEDGVHAGEYQYPHREALESAAGGDPPSVSVVYTRRGRLRRRSWFFDSIRVVR